jgi:hypothetical protein
MFGLSKKEKKEKLVAQYNSEVKDLLIQINSNTERSNLFASIQGGGFDFADALHNVFEDFGYPAKLHFFNFWNMFRRFGPAAAVVEIPPNLCWLSPPEVKGSDQFNSEFEKLAKNTRLWNRLKGLDKRQRVGRYAGLFIQVGDNKKPSEPVEALNGIGNIHNLKPIYEGQLEVSTTDTDAKSPTFGDPTMYTFSSGNTGNRDDRAAIAFQIHPSRLIVTAEGADDGTIYGISALENIFNDLMDLRKISGAGGEGYYQNTRSAPVIEAEAGFKPPTGKDGMKDLEQEIDDFLNKWRKKFVSQGLKFVYPDITLDNPKEFAENSWNNIAAGSGISSSVLRGTQTGVLAGDKDNQSTLTTMQSRRENYLTELVTDFVDWMIRHKVLPASEFEIIWDDLLAIGDDEKLSMGDKMAAINEASFKSALPAVFSVDEIRETSGFEKLDFEIPTEKLDDDGSDDGE